MPEFVEPLLNQLVTSYFGDPEFRRKAPDTIATPELAPLLGWYARKLAGKAVREHSRVDLRRGLIALAISAGSSDSRDILAPLGLLYNSTVRLHIDPFSLFQEILDLSGNRARRLFEGFLHRSPRDRSIGIFGFSEGEGPLGFDYIPLLPEYGGPTPF
jgi:hypothetical protein